MTPLRQVQNACGFGEGDVLRPSLEHRAQPPPESVNAAPSFADLVEAELDRIARMLIAKNAAYGNSALDPVRCFSKASTTEQLKVRIDDKISRLMRGHDAGEDVISDLIGYLVLLRISGETR